MAEDKIFVCYRRDDSAGHAGRLYDRLNQRFPGRVFMDVTSIGVGTRWAEVIDNTLRQCGVAVILIGRRWLEADGGGARRIDDPDDPMRAEIVAALRLKLKIVPVLVSGAAVPDRDDLPAHVAALTEWQALRVDDEDFDHDCARLIRALEAQLGTGSAADRPAANNTPAQLHRLMDDAQSAIGRQDWVTAAQTLQAALSLDRNHAQAAERLRFVQEQSKRAYSQPVAKRGSGLRWGIALGGVALLGIGSVVVIVLVLIIWAAGPQPGPNLGQVSDEPVKSAAGVLPTGPQRAGSSQPPEQTSPGALQGDYVLAAHSAQGIPQPWWSGNLRLVQVDARVFRFAMTLNDASRAAVFQYQGVSQANGRQWVMTATATNDVQMLNVPIVAEVSFDGAMLSVRNPSGQTFVWRKSGP